MASIAERLAGHPFFAGLPAESLDLVAGCASNVRFRAGEQLFREGDPADAFYVVRGGRVALEMRTPTGSAVLDTVESDEVVGWSWLVPPYRWSFDGRAVDDVRAVQFDGACLRGKCEADPELGYALLKRVVSVMNARLHSSRVRLLDLYGRS
jgi:CRP/FNR family transcriptional regulator, cyclic AMP receptor protein